MARTFISGIAADKNAQYVTAKNWINGEWIDSSSTPTALIRQPVAASGATRMQALPMRKVPSALL
jgi:hypothetical protein